MILAETFGLISIDRELRATQAVSHPAYAGASFTFGLEGSLGEYISTVMQTLIFGTILYFTLSLSSYYYFFRSNKNIYLPNFKGHLLIRHDIFLSLINLICETFLVAAIRVTYPRYSLLYYDVNEYGIPYLFLSIIFHVLYDETLTYWIHRWLHTFPYLYTKLHRHHHRSKDVTPFSGFAFHPLDAFAQALPTFTSCFIFPLHVNVQLIFGLMTTSWAISIHDNVPALPFKLLLYSTHHTIHHEAGTGGMKNIGKFTSVWDRLMGTYEEPDRIDFGWQNQKSQLKKLKWLNDIYETIVPIKKKVKQ